RRRWRPTPLGCSRSPPAAARRRRTERRPSCRRPGDAGAPRDVLPWDLLRSTGNHREDQTGGMERVVEDVLRRGCRVGIVGDAAPGVRVRLEGGELAGGHVEPEAVTGLDDDARRSEVDLEAIGGAGHPALWVAGARAHDALAETHGAAVGEDL